MESIVNRDANRKQRLDRKAWRLREKFTAGVGKARIAAELAREAGIDLGASLSPTSARCLSILMAQIEADEARYG